MSQLYVFLTLEIFIGKRILQVVNPVQNCPFGLPHQGDQNPVQSFLWTGGATEK